MLRNVIGWEICNQVQKLTQQEVYNTYAVNPEQLAEEYTAKGGDLEWCLLSNTTMESVDRNHNLYAPRKLAQAQPTQAMMAYKECRMWPEDELAAYYNDDSGYHAKQHRSKAHIYAFCNYS